MSCSYDPEKADKCPVDHKSAAILTDAARSSSSTATAIAAAESKLSLEREGTAGLFARGSDLYEQQPLPFYAIDSWLYDTLCLST